jgi:hypothetical protein
MAEEHNVLLLKINKKALKGESCEQLMQLKPLFVVDIRMNKPDVQKNYTKLNY